MKNTESLANHLNLLAGMERALQSAHIPIIITEAGLKRPKPCIVFADRA